MAIYLHSIYKKKKGNSPYYESYPLPSFSLRQRRKKILTFSQLSYRQLFYHRIFCRQPSYRRLSYHLPSCHA